MKTLYSRNIGYYNWKIDSYMDNKTYINGSKYKKFKVQSAHGLVKLINEKYWDAGYQDVGYGDYWGDDAGTYWDTS